MHCYKDVDSNITIKYNSDLSGTVRINDTSYDDIEIEIPGKVLKEFVISHLISEKISKLEQMTTEEFIEKFI